MYYFLLFVKIMLRPGRLKKIKICFAYNIIFASYLPEFSQRFITGKESAVFIFDINPFGYVVNQRSQEISLLLQPVFGQPSLRDVPIDSDHTHDITAVVPQRYLCHQHTANVAI